MEGEQGMADETYNNPALADRLTARNDEEQDAVADKTVTREQAVANSALEAQIQQRIDALNAEGRYEEANRIAGISEPDEGTKDQDQIRQVQTMQAAKPNLTPLQRRLRRDQ